MPSLTAHVITYLKERDTAFASRKRTAINANHRPDAAAHPTGGGGPISRRDADASATEPTACSSAGAHPEGEHWFDFICPFCYVGQSRTALLRAAGVTVAELSFPIHPEIGPGGVEAPDRHGALYAQLSAEAERAGLPLVWSEQIPYSRPALALSELVRARHHTHHSAFVKRVFDAYFVGGSDIEQPAVLRDCLAASGVDDTELMDVSSLAAGMRAVEESAAAGRAAGVTGTPAWMINGRLIIGLQADEVFRSIATATGGRRARDTDRDPTS